MLLFVLLINEYDQITNAMRQQPSLRPEVIHLGDKRMLNSLRRLTSTNERLRHVAKLSVLGMIEWKIERCWRLWGVGFESISCELHQHRRNGWNSTLAYVTRSRLYNFRQEQTICLLRWIAFKPSWSYRVNKQNWVIANFANLTHLFPHKWLSWCDFILSFKLRHLQHGLQNF